MQLIAGTGNRPLAEAVAVHLGLNLTQAKIRQFADKEIFVEIQESIRGEDVFVLQPTSTPVNDNLMELLLIVDTLRRSSARRITAVVPYFGYSRQDRRTEPRTPISAKLVANMIAAAGVDRVMTIDLHAGQLQGFFDIPLDNLYAAPLFIADIREKYGLDTGKNELLTIVSPDVGGVVRARGLAKRLGADLAIIDKRREKAGISEVMNIIGEVNGQNCLLLDDLVDSAGTLCNAAEAIVKAGAKSVAAYATHGVLSGRAVERIEASPLTSLTITDSIAPTENVEAASKIRKLSVASLLAEAIVCTHEERSISRLFL